MMSDHTPLRGPELLAEVQAIFGKMITRYGLPNVTKKWDGTELQHVHMDWTEVLDRCTRAMLWHAAGQLPASFPPTAAEFRALCIGAPPAPRAPELSAPPADPKRVSRMLAEANAKAADAVARQGGPKAWAYRLKALEDRGGKLTAVQKDMLRWAMRPDDPTSRPLNSDFKPPPIESLPAAMRADLHPEHGQHQGENHD